MAAPEWAGILHFAGEATSIEGFQCVHGAFLSGQRAAVEVAKTLQLPSKPKKRHPFEEVLEQGGSKRARLVEFGKYPRGRWLTQNPMQVAGRG